MENIQKIQDYLNNRLSAADKTAFEIEMKSNSILAKDVLLHQELRQALMYQNMFKMQETVQTIAAETPLEPDFEGYKSLVKQGKWWTNGHFWIVGITLLAVLTGSVLFYQYQANNTKLQAIAAPYWSETFDYAVRIDEADPSNFAKGMRSYKSGNYVAATIDLEKHISQKTGDSMTQLYLGIAYALSQQQEKAIEKLSPLAAANDEFSSYARWYLALCYLRDGKGNAARQWLLTLKNDAVYGVRAGEVLNKL